MGKLFGLVLVGVGLGFLILPEKKKEGTPTSAPTKTEAVAAVPPPVVIPGLPKVAVQDEPKTPIVASAPKGAE